ncbi:MAG: hypothetical protein P0Y50_03895 [Candidatus Brevundimonas colombiensis]|uniref:Uncharacterized protein n=1 Tax=Candidatus Brevundimonas colombiensis TaxID=3121376 RepID=A0AAJ5X0J3_9CAUL|nr:hypothetical protein [Brevundimonas sp.]WEK40764.1 MAG: hypothetical protein P0Y50_03895 [Brevundimonas sp.]
MPAFERMSWHRRWLALDDAHKRQVEAWDRLNAHLERQPGWFALSEDYKAEVQRLCGLAEIEDRMRVIHRRLRRSLRALPKTPCRDLDGVVANLRVAERLLPPEENRIVHGLIVRAARDLVQIRDAQ